MYVHMRVCARVCVKIFMGSLRGEMPRGLLRESMWVSGQPQCEWSLVMMAVGDPWGIIAASVGGVSGEAATIKDEGKKKGLKRHEGI